MSFREFGAKTYRFATVREGLPSPALFEEELSQVALRFRQRRIDPHRVSEIGLRLLLVIEQAKGVA